MILRLNMTSYMVIRMVLVKHLVALTGDLSSSPCVCGCVVNGVSAMAAT